MTLAFTKMHGLGNDFMVVDNRQQTMNLEPNYIQSLADRKTGIGFDQLLLLENAQRPDMQFRYRIVNANGTEVSQCGNGARCFARFIQEQGLTDRGQFWVETNAGEIELKLLDNGQVQVNMGVPTFEPADIPLIAPGRENRYSIQFENQSLPFMVTQIGNPHAVFELGPVEQAPVAALGALAQTSSLFPEQVNVGFMQVLSPKEIDLRVFERGVGETLACGSGACAAVATGVVDHRLQGQVKVNLRGGPLTVDYAGEGEPVFLTGPATTVYTGQLDNG